MTGSRSLARMLVQKYLRFICATFLRNSPCAVSLEGHCWETWIISFKITLSWLSLTVRVLSVCGQKLGNPQCRQSAVKSVCHPHSPTPAAFRGCWICSCPLVSAAFGCGNAGPASASAASSQAAGGRHCGPGTGWRDRKALRVGACRGGAQGRGLRPVRTF